MAENSLVCVICQKFHSESAEDYFVSVSCGHIYHHICILSLIRHASAPELPKCPLCKSLVDITSFRKLLGLECIIKSFKVEQEPIISDDISLRVVVLGDVVVGKSCLLRRFAQDKYKEEVSAGYDKFQKRLYIGSKGVVLNLWDTNGQERYESITCSYLRNLDAIIFVYAIDDAKSFIRINHWMDFFEKHGGDSCENCIKLLIGAKADLSDRQVDRYDAACYARRQGMEFFEVSARDPTHKIQDYVCSVDAPFNYLAKMAIERIDLLPSGQRNDTITVGENTREPSRRC